MNLARLDMNLLLSLEALLRCRNVTRAAEQLGLTQSALSASLGRLRRHFDDPLLVRVGNTYRLTPLASQLEERTRGAITAFDRVFDAQTEFRPATATREFSILITDYALSVLGPGVARILEVEAPGTRLRFEGNSPSIVHRAEHTLLNHDLLVMPHGDLLDLPYRDLHSDRWLLVMSADNPAADGEPTVEDLREMAWVAPFYGPLSATPAVRQMRILGIEPRVTVMVESFLAVPALVVGTDRVAMLQEHLVRRLSGDSGLRTVPCPFEVSPFVEAMWWHPGRDADEEHRYLREVVARAGQELAASA